MSFLHTEFRLHKQTVVLFLIIGLLAVYGTWLLAYSTPFGLGLNDDLIAYIAGARSILSGNGYREAWLVSNGPVTHFPPGYPVVLAAIGYVTGLDPVRGARALSGVLFGLNTALTGWLGFRMTQNRATGILAASLTLLSNSLLHIHARAMSEPLYLTLLLIGFIFLDVFFQKPRTQILILLGIVLGWAYLARYAALALLATMATTLLVLQSNWQKRITTAAILVASAIPWVLAWSIRNRIVGGTFTNRVLGWHPISIDNWNLGVSTFAQFLVPVNSWRKNLASIPGIYEVLLLGIGFTLLVWVLHKSYLWLLRPSREDMPNPLTLTNGLFIVVYLFALVTTMTLFDPATKFQVRILSPTYIPLILLFVTFGNWLWNRKGKTIRSLILLVGVGFVGMFAYGQSITVQNLRRGGTVFASERWADSEAIADLNKLPEDVLILSDEPGLVYLYTGRPSGALPDAILDGSRLKSIILDGKVVLALFSVNTVDAETLKYYYDLGRGLYLHDYSSVWIFGAFPE